MVSATAALITTLADRVLDPAIARIGATAPRGPTDPWRRFESALEALLARASIAAQMRSSLEWSDTRPESRPSRTSVTGARHE
jgi:hypothetical protein